MSLRNMSTSCLMADAAPVHGCCFGTVDQVGACEGGAIADGQDSSSHLDL